MLILLVPATAAMAKRKVIAPPGDSAVSQYVEDVPTAGGGTPSQPPSGGAPHSGVLTPGQTRSLHRLGPDGRLLATVVDSTAPASAGTAASSAGAGRNGATGAARGGGSRMNGAGTSGAGTAGAASASGRGASGSGAGGRAGRPRGTGSGVLDGPAVGSPASQVVRALGGGGAGGLGPALPALMAASVVAALIWSLRRRRTSA